MVLDVFRVSFQNFEVENTDALVSRYEEVFVEGDFDHFKVFTTESKQAGEAWFDFTNSFLYQTRHINALHVKMFRIFLKRASTGEIIGQTAIDLRTLACGPRNYSLPFQEGGDVKFEVIMHHELDVEIHLSDVVVSDVRGHDKIVLAYQFSYAASPYGEGELFKSRKIDRNHKTNSFLVQGPPYIHHNASLKDLFHADIKFRVFEPKVFGFGPLIGEGQIAVVEYLSMNANQQVPFECILTIDDCRVCSVTGCLQFKNVPRFTPMQGGCFSPEGLHGARPLLAQVEFPAFRTGMGPPFSLLKSSQARNQNRVGAFLRSGGSSSADPAFQEVNAEQLASPFVVQPAAPFLSGGASATPFAPADAPVPLSALPASGATAFCLQKRQFNNPYLQNQALNLPDPSDHFGSGPPPVLRSESEVSVSSDHEPAEGYSFLLGSEGPGPSLYTVSAAVGALSAVGQAVAVPALSKAEEAAVADLVEEDRRKEEVAAVEEAKNLHAKQNANFLAGGEAANEEERAPPPSYEEILATSPGVQSQAFVFGGTGTDTMEQQPPGYEELFANQGGEGEEDGEDREESVDQGSAKEANSFKEMDGVTVARNSDGTFTVFSSGGGGTGVGGIPLSETRTGADVTVQAAKAQQSLDGNVLYFECFIEYGENDATIIIGFGPQNFEVTHHIGNDPQSFGYNGSDGYICLEGKRRNFGTLFGPGDVVGLGYKRDTLELFCTRNGSFLGTAYMGVPELCFVPSITLLGRNIQLKVNFGGAPFAFDSEAVCMPPGFTMMQDSLRRPYFVDHRSRKTTWNDPRTDFPMWRYLVDQNDFMVDRLKDEGRFHRPKVGQALRLVPRGAFLPDGVNEEAYEEKTISLVSPEIEVLPPWLISFVMEQLCLGDCLGWRVLCVGSGTGHFSTMAGLLVGESGISLGMDIKQEIVDFANERLEDYIIQTGRFISNVSFHKRNMLLPKSAQDGAKYDRIFVTGGISELFLPTLMEYLEVGGVMIVCVDGNLERISLHPDSVSRNILLPLQLPLLQEPSEEDIANVMNAAFWEQLVEMGYHPVGSSLAVEKYGSNREKIFNFLDAFKSMLDLGYPQEDCAEALFAKDCKLEEAVNFLLGM